MQVHQILKTKKDTAVVTVTLGQRIRAAAKILAARRIGTVVVSDDGNTIAGILSERDIVRAPAQKGPECLVEPVEHYMTSTVQICALSDSADAILGRMTEGRFRHMPVIEGTMLVGLITIGDVVKAKLNELAMENQALEAMIKGH